MKPHWGLVPLTDDALTDDALTDDALTDDASSKLSFAVWMKFLYLQIFLLVLLRNTRVPLSVTQKSAGSSA